MCHGRNNRVTLFNTTWGKTYQIFLKERVRIFIEIDGNTFQDALPSGVDVITLK